MVNMYTLGKKMKRNSRFSHRQVLSMCDIDFNHKVISAIGNLRFNLHIIRNCCAKYDPIPSIHQTGVCIMSSVTFFKNI